MHPVKERFIVDETGNKLGVILSINDYEKLLAELEEQEEIRAYDKAKSMNDELIPFETAIKEIGL